MPLKDVAHWLAMTLHISYFHLKRLLTKGQVHEPPFALLPHHRMVINIAFRLLQVKMRDRGIDKIGRPFLWDHCPNHSPQSHHFYLC